MSYSRAARPDAHGTRDAKEDYLGYIAPPILRAWPDASA